jgi:heme/copper-type cytochrome/quinol oxidase subunit 2
MNHHINKIIPIIIENISNKKIPLKYYISSLILLLSLFPYHLITYILHLIFFNKAESPYSSILTFLISRVAILLCTLVLSFLNLLFLYEVIMEKNESTVKSRLHSILYWVINFVILVVLLYISLQTYERLRVFR